MRPHYLLAHGDFSIITFGYFCDLIAFSSVIACLLAYHFRNLSSSIDFIFFFFVPIFCGFRYSNLVLINHYSYNLLYLSFIYLTGHYNPSVRVMTYISGGTYSLKSTPNDRFFTIFFMAIFILFSEYLPEIC